MINTAMILAAGLGKRMLPLTNTTPKPLLEVAGKPLIEWALMPFEGLGNSFGNVVVNGFHLASQVEGWSKSRNITFIKESTHLETGGGVKNAILNLPMGAEFFVANSDSFFPNQPSPIEAMIQAWDGSKMDALLLLHHPSRKTIGYYQSGDYILHQDGTLTRAKNEPNALAFCGIQILRAAPFENMPADTSFSLNEIYQRAEKHSRLYGLVYEGDWFHIGDTSALNEADSILRAMLK